MKSPLREILDAQMALRGAPQGTPPYLDPLLRWRDEASREVLAHLGELRATLRCLEAGGEPLQLEIMPNWHPASAVVDFSVTLRGGLIRLVSHCTLRSTREGYLPSAPEPLPPNRLTSYWQGESLEGYPAWLTRFVAEATKQPGIAYPPLQHLLDTP